MFARSYLLTAMTCMVLCLHSIGSMASVVITGTRVIYPLNAKDVSVRLSNNGTLPSLVQAWIDDGRETANPESISVPFILSPPVSRINPDHSQLLRLVYTGEDHAPRDRETVYWLNVLDIPPKPDVSSGDNTIQFAVRSRIKLFLRPPELTGDPSLAPAQVTWRLVREGDVLHLQASNPTPFYVSFAEVALVSEGGVTGKNMSGMVDPVAERAFVLDETYKVGSGPLSVNFKYVNDYGAFVDGSAAVTLGH